MYQQINTTQMPVVKPVNDIIINLVNEANALIKEVTADYQINSDTGEIVGKRLKPSLVGEQHYDHGTIGYVAAGNAGIVTANNYFKTEPFAQRIEKLHYLSIVSLAEKIANLEDADKPVTEYEPIGVASTFDGLFIEALAVVLTEHGFYVELTSTPNYNNPNGPKELIGAYSFEQWSRPLPLRGTRAAFVERWKRVLNGIPEAYSQAYGLALQPVSNQQPVQEVDNQADEQQQ
ncbi:hypothetical protein pEaSNUABM37_00299 [Erwinia phage pEa_SNUABM_37]|nr:hypothetical protein pEaSNUABM37_00299 [Erwinia phage pEa_SNUABM_37]QXO10767.1 hypothetical protein pEaSNUABM48_00299 [Erwinia phage pEa_SNUABM_48]